MSNNYFIRKLEEVCDDARRTSSFIDPSFVYMHSSKYLDQDSHLFTEEGKHLFSLCHSILPSTMTHIFNSVKESPPHNFFHSLDKDYKSIFHYSALHSLDEVFHFLCDRGNSTTGLDFEIIKSLCLFNHPDTNESVSSILIEKDKAHILANCLCDTLHIDPFQSEFDNMYSTWLHECILVDAKRTANYLLKCHNKGMEKSLVRSYNSHPVEPLTPLDIVFTSEHNCQMYYIDAILGNFEHGFKLGRVKIEYLVSSIKRIRRMTNFDVPDFIAKCVADTIKYKTL